MEKNIKRKEYKDIRKNLKYEDFSLKITKLSEYKNAKTVFIYLSYLDEAKTDKLISEALKTKTVLVPYCVDKNGTMIACEIKSFDELKKGSFGIREPVNSVSFNGKIDLAVVPGLAFSKDGHRIGYGKGYYDRFLEKNPAYSVGLTFDELVFDEIPSDDHDKRVNMIITQGKEIKIL